MHPVEEQRTGEAEAEGGGATEGGAATVANFEFAGRTYEICKLKRKLAPV